MKSLVLFLVFVLVASSSFAESYRWINSNGTLCFSDKPCSVDTFACVQKGKKQKRGTVVDRSKNDKLRSNTKTCL